MKLDQAAVRRVAALATVDPRSVRRELAEPGSVRGTAGQRIRIAIAALGLGTFVVVDVPSFPASPMASSGGGGPRA